MFKIILLFGLINYGHCVTKGVKLLKSVEYMTDLSQNFIYELEDYGLCNTLLTDMIQNISRVNFYGYDVIGTVYYKRGFLNSFQQASLYRLPNEANIDEIENSVHMESHLVFSSLIFYYDFYADLTIGQIKGTVSIPMNNLEGKLKVSKFYKNNTIIAKYVNTAYQAGLAKVWGFEPSNHITQIINKDILFDFALSISNIEKLWTKILKRAMKKIDFPIMCYMC